MQIEITLYASVYFLTFTIMSLNPLNELKRRLDDDSTPLPKRLCLAKNMVQSHHFPSAPKERIIADWLETLSRTNKLDNTELQKVLDWSSYEDLTGELKCKLIQVVSQFVQKNILKTTDIQFIIKFLENEKISLQLSQQIDDYLNITVTLLQCLKGTEISDTNLSQKILINFIKYYKESKKKLEFVTKFIVGENLETVFSYLETENRNTVIEVCQNVLFHANKKTLFINYLQTLVRKDNLDSLIAEKGDNIQAVLKIMSIFFDFPKHRTENDTKFLQNFIEVFVSSYKTEGQMIFAFYIMAANVLNLKQDYIIPSMALQPIEKPEKSKRHLFLSMLEIVLKNEVDISVKLTDTMGAKPSKVEMKKSFILFLQAVMMGQLKLEGKLDKTTLQIIKTALKLDPILIEQNLELILPPIMTAKKNNIMDSYIETLNCLMETLFKLSRGNLFITDILPSLKMNLMSNDKEQIDLIEKIKESDDEKSKSKLINGNDVFPQECVELYGKLTTELMFRQNKELLESLQKDLQMHVLSMLEGDAISPSTTTLAEVLSAILSSFLRHNKMADHTVPQNIAEDFWGLYSRFETDGLRRFGEAVVKLSDNKSLLTAFLHLCQSYAQLKLLNLKYSHNKLNVLCTSEVFDLSGLLPCLDREQWMQIGKVADGEPLVVLDNLLLLKTMAMEVLAIRSDDNSNEALQETKSYLIKRLASNPAILESNTYIPRVLFANLDKSQNKQLAKSLVKLYLNEELTEIFKNVAITNNRLLLNALVLEVAKNVAKCLHNCDDLAKAFSKDFNMVAFAKEVDMKKYFNDINIQENSDDKIKKCIELMKSLQISYLEENYQLTAVFMLLAVKKCCQSKKIRKNVDGLMQSIFELSAHPPDLYQVFPVDFIFCFKDTTMIDLLTLKIKTSNQLLVIKNLIESAVKRVRVESDLVKSIVELLLSKKSSKNNTIDAFSDARFQISCIMLPLLVKQRKAITTSAFRSILADLQEKLHKPLLDTFKNVDFSNSTSATENSSVIGRVSSAGNTDDSMAESDGNVVATLNAMAAFSLCLSKYCESTEVEDKKNLDCLFSGLSFFVDNAIQTINNSDSKPQHVESSIQLLNVILRHIKKLESHDIFNNKDDLFTQIWLSINSRLLKVFENGGSLRRCGYLEDMGNVLKSVCELVSVERFVGKFVGDLANLAVLKPPSAITKDKTKLDLTTHSVSKYLWTQCLKANTAGPKCNAMTRLMHQSCNNLKSWIRQHYDSTFASVASKRKLDVYGENRVVKVDDSVCDLIRVDLDTLSEVIFAGKRVTLDYKFLDSIFELQHMVHMILGFSTSHIKCDITWPAYFTLFEGSVGVLNSLLVCREEILEDRWPCFMQCYRALTSTLCIKSTSQVPLERHIDEKLAEIAHSIEKLTQSISKRKKHVSRISAYTVADICTALERNAPSRMVRQHLENSVALLIQASDSAYAMAFLKRALAGSVGQMTMSNLYTMYKRYHKYTGNA